jgi:SPP1 gp7 family putative phage head morphogenesis protein
MSDNRDKRTWDEVTDAIAGILLLGVGAVAIGLLVAQLLRLGLSRAYADRLAMLLVAEGPFVVSPLQVPGPCEEFERHQAAGWTALFAVAAADRLLRTEELKGRPADRAVEAEATYYQQHVVAEERRLRAAIMQDAAAQVIGQDGLLGWRAVIDERVTPECRWANGRNYRADQMPVIGFPGAVHARCRCAASFPLPGAPLLPSI